jgi:hypothetical protein
MEKTLADLTEEKRHMDRARAALDAMRTLALRQPLNLLPETPAHQRLKAAASAYTSTGNTQLATTLWQDLVGIVQPLLARMGVVSAPRNITIVDAPDEAVGAFARDGGPFPVAMLTLSTGVLTTLSQLGVIYGVSSDLLRSTDGRARTLLDSVFVRGLRRLEDSELLSSTGAITGQRPAGLLSAALEVGGGSPAVLETAIAEMFGFVTDGKPGRPFFIASPRGALWLALQQTEGGARFPNARADGAGDIAGVPLLTSPAAGNKLVLVDASKLVITDEGLDVSASESAALQMDTTPTDGAANVVAAFQTNTTFVRIVRFLHWELVTTDAVAFIEIGELAGSPS